VCCCAFFQGTLPRYAQIRHGPIEYGKDIAALVDDGGVSVLCLYQIKCGEMNTTKWREARPELEEMFLVPMSEFQLPIPPQRVEGYLVTNGHVNPYVEPVMEGWFEEQQRDHGRDITFIHLDALIDGIFKVRLVNELRAALAEEGIEINIIGSRDVRSTSGKRDHAVLWAAASKREQKI
jgi:hypothetical protein